MSEVRLIDANALDDSFRHSIVKCKQWFEDAAAFGEEESKARAEQAYVTFMECSMRLKQQPTVDAVPVEWIEGFMDWLDSKGYTISSAIIQKMLNDYCADGERIEHE